MGIINRYIFREVWIPALLAFAVVAFLAMLRGLIEELRDLPIDQMTLGDVVRLGLYSAPAFIGYVIPLTYLMGILFAFGRLGQRNEFIAMKAAGIPMQRIVVPVILVGGLLSVGSFAVQDRVQPWALSRVANLIYTELPLRASIALLPTGQAHSFGDWHVFIERRDERTGALYDLRIRRPQDGGQARYYAASARMVQAERGMALELRDGYLVLPQREDRFMPVMFSRAVLNVPALEPRDAPGARERRMLEELWAMQASLAREYEETQRLPVLRDLILERNVIRDRLSLPLMCLAVSVIAAPLGVRASRHGRSYAFGLGVAIVGAYFILQSVTEPRALLPLPAVIALGQIPNAVLLAVGAVLVRRADHL